MAHSPEQLMERFSALLAAKDLEGLVALYESDASFAPQPGMVVSGKDAIREALRPFVTLDGSLQSEIASVLRSADTALVHNSWTLEGTGPNGQEIRMGGTSADVLRLRPDGSWGIAIDNPWGAVTEPPTEAARG
jgi:uncharacterized protein (TIGR02246 family)